jgi:RimJ/RimL family protein N-acetyltransferase
VSAEQITLRRSGFARGVILRSIAASDIETLRNWKNGQRLFFFDKAIITSERQREWFAGFQSRPDDYMFIVQAREVDIGCMGIRNLGALWDVYNVILGAQDHGGKGYMSEALILMLNFAYHRSPNPVQLSVLKENPAVRWYEKNGFTAIQEAADHYVMAHDRGIMSHA